MLQQAAGYVGRDGEFAELMGILDYELRMVTPVDVEGLIADGREPPRSPREPHYQLTHDYLVPPLRQWLTRKHGETLGGRARLCLVERTALWTNKRDEAAPELAGMGEHPVRHQTSLLDHPAAPDDAGSLWTPPDPLGNDPWHVRDHRRRGAARAPSSARAVGGARTSGTFPRLNCDICPGCSIVCGLT